MRMVNVLEQIEIDDETLLKIHNQIDPKNNPESLQMMDTRITGGTKEGETFARVSYRNFDVCHISEKGRYECDIILDAKNRFSGILYPPKA